MPLNHSTNRIIDDNIKTDLGLKEGYDSLPKQVVPTIQPTYEVLRRVANIVRSGGNTSTTSLSYFTTPADRDFYLTGVYLSITKDATCDLASGTVNITATIAGVSTSLIRITTLTLTAQDKEVYVSFPQPIKIDRNTSITTATTTFTAGAMSKAGSIWGFTNLPSQVERIIEVS